MLKGFLVATALAASVAGAAEAQGQPRDPLNGQFGAMEIAMSPAAAAEDAIRMGEALAKLAPQRPGVVDTYVLSAAFWDEPVFENEAREAANVLARRYDAAERTLVLSAGRGPGVARAVSGGEPWGGQGAAMKGRVVRLHRAAEAPQACRVACRFVCLAGKIANH